MMSPHRNNVASVSYLQLFSVSTLSAQKKTQSLQSKLRSVFSLTLYVLMDSFIWSDTMNLALLELFIVYIEGSQLIIFQLKSNFFLFQLFLS